MIGVYLGRPFEQWSYDAIMREFGEIHFYVNEKRGVPLVVTDDDLSGTFTFVRALVDYDYSPTTGGSLWQQAWVNGAHHFDAWFTEAFRISQNSGTGLIMQGGRDWDDYEVSAAVVPHMSAEAGIAARVQGLQRYYALLLCQDQTVRLVKVLDERTVLAEIPYG